jgi:hypothetical protein
VLDLRNSEIRRTPFPHVVVDNFIAPSLYQALCSSFPVCPANSGPTGYSYFWGDPEYDALIAGNPAWKSLFELTQSQKFIDYCVSQFGDVCREYDCTIDLGRARYVAYCESRADKELRYLSHVDLQPHELWVRTDILQGNTGYSRRVHLDHRRRLIALLIYCCDADENKMEGGDLVLHAPKRGEVSLGEDATIRPRHNRMVAFACSNNSLHSVPEIRSQLAPRNFIQITVSSSVDAWPDHRSSFDRLKDTARSILMPRRRTAPVGN